MSKARYYGTYRIGEQPWADHASFMLGYTDGISNTVSLVSS